MNNPVKLASTAPARQAHAEPLTARHAGLKQEIDTILTQSTEKAEGVPGVVAMVTDRYSNIYEGAAGTRELGRDRPMSHDAVFALMSTTKAICGVTVMQLVEEGKIKLSDPARAYAPDIANIGVLEGFDADGQPRTRPPKRDITINDLMLHTSGFSYEFFSENDLRYRTAMKIPSIVTSTDAAIRSVLLHDPGERWTYGVGIDWLGKIVEQQRGKRLGEVMQDRIFEPLDIQDMAFTMTPSMAARRMTIHDRDPNGHLTPMPDFMLPQAPELQSGGGGLYGTVGEYMKFIRMILNDGAGPKGRVLKPETVARMCEDGLAQHQSSGTWKGSLPALANDGEFLPSVDKGWAYTFMVNRERSPTGRPTGSLMWSGLANCFYWIDRKNGVGGYWASQILPFQDRDSYPGFVAMESAVYRSIEN